MDLFSQDLAKLDSEFDEQVELPTKIKASMVVFKNLAQTLQKQQFCDLIFELTGSIKFHTHRLVVALWSPVMMNMLNQSSCRVEKVLVKSNLQDAFKQFVHFLYTGTFEGNITDIQGVLLLASTFQIPLLRNLCEKHLHQTMSIDNVIGLFHLSVRFKLSCLEWQCVEHIRQHLPEVAQQSELKDLTPEQFNTFLASQHVSKLNPEMKLFLIISWLTEQVTERQHFLVLLLGHIDWSAVAQDFLTEIRQTENFFTSHPSSLYLLLQTLHSASISLGPYADRFEDLRKEHSEILKNVVSSSVHIGTGRHETFQPISLTVISGPSRDKMLPGTKSDGGDKPESKVKLRGVSNEKQEVSSQVKGSRSISDWNTSTEHVTNKKGSVQSKNVSVGSGQSNTNGDKKPTLSHSLRAVSESGSTRRKTLRPRKVVSNSSVSIISNKGSSGRRSTASQKDKESDSDLSTMKTGVGQEDENHGELEEQDEQPETFAEDVDEDEEVALAKRRLRRAKPKLEVEAKPKMGRPRKGYERSKFSCTQCEYVTRHSYLLDKHTRQVHECKRIIKCPICEFQCNWSKKLYLHMRSDHYNNSGPPFHCDIQECTYSVDKINKLVEHRRSHTGDRPFLCDECKMSFRSKSNLYAHLKCHNAEKQFKCPKCPRAFKMKITLEQHLVIHEDLRAYLCDLCGFSTKYHSHLVAHRRKHTGDVFPCTFPACKYSTPKKSTLQAHMRSHLGIRQHVCDICGKAFIEKSHLVRHKRIHTTEKQHKCTLCDYASHRQDKLREHMQKHEKEANQQLAHTDSGKGSLSEPKKRKRRKKAETQTAKDVDSSLPEEPRETPCESGLPLDASSALSLPGAMEGDGQMMAPSVNVGMERSVPPRPLGGSHFTHDHNRTFVLQPKQEKEWNDLELLSFTVAEGQNHSVAVMRGNHPEEIAAGVGSANNAMTEFSDIFRGFEAPTSTVTGDQSLHTNISQVPESQIGGGVNPADHNCPPPLAPSGGAAMLSSFSPQNMQSDHQRGKTPHPIVMIPNMNAPMTTPQPYLHQHQPHHHSHLQTQPQVMQQHHQHVVLQQQQQQKEEQHYTRQHPPSLPPPHHHHQQQLLQHHGIPNNPHGPGFPHFSM